MAVSNIVRGVSELLWMILEAFSSTCTTLVSNIIGAGREDKVISLIKRILKLDVAICWSAEHVYALSLLIFCLIYLKSGRWKNRKI